MTAADLLGSLLHTCVGNLIKLSSFCGPAEMELSSSDVWGHFAPMFHLVDAFAMYAITLVGGRHAILPTFSAHSALQTIGDLHDYAM